jgi:hypothetical protein
MLKVVVDVTFDEPQPVIQAVALAAEEQLGDCSRVAMLSFDEVRSVNRAM